MTPWSPKIVRRISGVLRALWFFPATMSLAGVALGFALPAVDTIPTSSRQQLASDTASEGAPHDQAFPPRRAGVRGPDVHPRVRVALLVLPRVYEGLGIYNRTEPIIPLGMLSMAIQALVMAYLYPFFRRDGAPIRRGVVFGVWMGAFLFSVSTLANAAKIFVADMGTWLAIQAAFHLVQFAVAGALIGLAYGRPIAHAEQRSIRSDHGGAAS